MSVFKSITDQAWVILEYLWRMSSDSVILGPILRYRVKINGPYSHGVNSISMYNLEKVEISPSSDSGEKNLTNELEFWMTNLPHRLRSIPIIHLAIPGSHDSTTYGITSKSKLAPDAEPLLHRLSFLGPLLTFIMAKWTRTQVFKVLEQLKSGIRYFDLRISTRNGTDQLFFVHGLYSVEVTGVLEEVREFLDTHPREIVILDCQHFYAFRHTDHEKFMQILTSVFGHKLLPYTPHMEHLSLEYMTTQFRYQVIVIYRSDAARFGQPLLWPSVCFPTPWPDTVSVQKLLSALDEGLKNRNFTLGYVTQCVLTPTTWFVCKNIFGSLKSKCVLPLEKQKYIWLNKQKPGSGGINIVISDFIDYQACQFSREVIGLNQKLLESPQKSSNSDVSVMTPVDDS